LNTVDAGEALRALLEMQPNGVDLDRFAVARNFTRQERERIFATVDMISVATGRETLGFAPAHWSGMRDRIIGSVEEWHRLKPDSWGPAENELRQRAGMESLREAVAARVRVLIDEGELLRMGPRLHRPGHTPVLSPQDLLLWQRVEPLLVAGGVRPPSIGHLAASLGVTVAAVETFLKHAAQLGLVLQIAENRFFPPEAAAELASAARDLAQGREDGLFSAAEFRDRTGIGRNITIRVLEYFDRCGLTQRAGERRRVVRPPEQLFGDAAH
jgi:selenocysteine-specific elongation factor